MVGTSDTASTFSTRSTRLKPALSKVENQVLRSHAACCVEEAIASGDADLQRAKFNELVEVFAKAKL